MQHSALRCHLIETALAMNASGINQGASGNLSVRVDGGYLITPSAVPYDQMTPDQICHISSQGQVSGELAPSTEWRFHHEIYARRTDASAVIHAHPGYCTAVACLERSIPAFHYMVAVAGGRDIRCAPYATFGSQALSDYALEALVDRKAALLAHHGVLCLERSLDACLQLAVEVEHLAEVYLHCLKITEPRCLPDDEMERVLEKFSAYSCGESRSR